MKKIISMMVIVFIFTLMLTGCGNNQINNNNKISILTTIFPEYDWVKNILGDKESDFDVSLLLDSGVDLHSFQPSADDIIRISNSDLFIYVGGESDEWIEDVLDEATNKNQVVVNLLDVLGDAVKEEEIKEGMQVEEHDEHEESEEVEYDEHVWLSLKKSSVLVNAICDALVKLDPGNENVYKENASAYIQKINNLDEKYKATVDESKVKSVIVGDRFPFRYLVDDYGLDYFAAFAGCSAESEASFETIAFLANKLDETKINTVLTLEGSNKKIAETIVATSKNKSAQILSMNSMQSVTLNDIKKGVTYLSIMEENLGTLKEALK